MCPGCVPGCVIARKTVVLEVCLARFLFASRESACRPRWSSGRLSRRSAICQSHHWFCVGDVAGSFEAIARWPLAPLTVVVDGGTVVGRGALMSDDECASWVAAAWYAKKDGERRRAVMQRSVSACRHPPSRSKRLCPDQGGRQSMLQFVTYTQELGYSQENHVFRSER
jgi:hypothetical protein